MSKRLNRCALLVLACSAASIPPASAAVLVSGDPVLYWNQVMTGGGLGSPPQQARAIAMVNIAIHDAVNATVGSPNIPYLTGVMTPGGDSRAAAAQAARDVLVHLNPANTAAYDAELASSLALVPDGQAKIDGISTGSTFAAAIIADRANDGSVAMVPYMPSGLPGRWAPTPPGNPASLPQWGMVDPFVMTSGSQFRPGPPPALDSAAWEEAYNEVLAIGSVDSALRTLDQTASATFWQNSPGSLAWLQLGLNAAEDEGLSIIENAGLFGMLGVGFADSQIAGFDAKYHYDFWRPVTAINNGELDGSPLTIGDPSWTPLNPAPAHPSYVSTLSSISAVGATTLVSVIGDEPVCLTAAGVTRCWDSIGQASLDAADSRVWGGIHYGFDSRAGLQLGEQIASQVLGGPTFNAVPEPSTWAMLLLGFGLVGSVFRRRRLSVSYS